MLGRLDGIPVLNYHGIAAHDVDDNLPDRKFWVAAPTLRQQIDRIRHAGYRTGLLAEHWGATEPAPSTRSVVLTFDDGRASDYEIAFPLLLEMGARAEFFVNTAAVETPGHLTWRQIEEMHRAGMRFQSHAHDHVVLLTLSPTALEWQLSTSKRLLENRLGRAVEFVAAPYGLLGHRVVDMASRLGYRAVCNSRQWPARPGRRIVNRVAIQADTTPVHFAGLIAGDPAAYLPGFTAMALKEIPKRVLLRFRPGALGVTLASQRA